MDFKPQNSRSCNRRFGGFSPWFNSTEKKFKVWDGSNISTFIPRIESDRLPTDADNIYTIGTEWEFDSRVFKLLDAQAKSVLIDNLEKNDDATITSNNVWQNFTVLPNTIIEKIVVSLGKNTTTNLSAKIEVTDTPNGFGAAELSSTISLDLTPGNVEAEFVFDNPSALSGQLSWRLRTVPETEEIVIHGGNKLAGQDSGTFGNEESNLTFEDGWSFDVYSVNSTSGFANWVELKDLLSNYVGEYDSIDAIATANPDAKQGQYAQLKVLTDPPGVYVATRRGDAPNFTYSWSRERIGRSPNAAFVKVTVYDSIADIPTDNSTESREYALYKNAGGDYKSKLRVFGNSYNTDVTVAVVAETEAELLPEIAETEYFNSIRAFRLEIIGLERFVYFNGEEWIELASLTDIPSQQLTEKLITDQLATVKAELEDRDRPHFSRILSGLEVTIGGDPTKLNRTAGKIARYTEDLEKNGNWEIVDIAATTIDYQQD